MKDQTLTAEALRQHAHHPFGTPSIPRQQYSIIRHADQAGPAYESGSHCLLEPLAQHMVQVHICEQRRDDPSLRTSVFRVSPHRRRHIMEFYFLCLVLLNACWHVKNYADGGRPCGHDIKLALWNPGALPVRPLCQIRCHTDGLSTLGRYGSERSPDVVKAFKDKAVASLLPPESAIERQREVGVRKTMGALPADILRQHLGESVLLALIALVPAIALLELLLPAFQTLLPFVALFDAGWDEYALLTFIACIVGLANGAYPALILSKVRPQAVLKAGPGGRPNLRSLLVGAQFCFASMLLIGTAALYLQLAVIRAQPLGFSAENLLMLALSDQEQANVAALGVELEKIPGVIGVVPLNTQPNPNFTNATTLARQSSDIDGIETLVVAFFSGFFDVMNIPLLAGRIPDPVPDAAQSAQNGTPAQPLERPMIVNRSAVRALGFASPEEAIEQVVFVRNTSNQTGQISHDPIRIVGVVEDNMYTSLRRMPGPELYAQQSLDDYVAGLVVKYEEVIGDTLQERIQQIAQAVNGRPLQYLRFMEPELQAAFRQEQNESRLLLICGGLALLLACIGLYGLAAFAIERRIKEVGVRKVMGASVLTIVVLYLWRFSRPVLIANLLAWPFAIYFVLQWIERFPYQLEKAWLLPLCLGAALAVLLISLLTVSIITVRAAGAKPIQSLRYE